jgi:hypothetical protein
LRWTFLISLRKLQFSRPEALRWTFLISLAVDFFNFPEKTSVFPAGGLAVVLFNFPEKTSVFPAGQKIGTIFCPKGGLAVVLFNLDRRKVISTIFAVIFFAQKIRDFARKGPFCTFFNFRATRVKELNIIFAYIVVPVKSLILAKNPAFTVNFKNY